MKNSLVTFALILSFTSLLAQQDTLYLSTTSNISKTSQNKTLISELSSYLSKKMARPVAIVYAGSTSHSLEMIKAGKIDIALMNTFGYILGATEQKIEPLLVIADKNKQPIIYQSCIIAHPSTQISSIDQLKTKAGQYAFMFVNPSSTSGHLIPRLFMNKQNLQPEYHFIDITFGGSHQETVMKIKKGEAKVGACSYTDLLTMISQGQIAKSDINVLWISDAIVNGPIAVKTSLSNSIKNKIKEAFKDLPSDNPELQSKLSKIWHNTTVNDIYVDAKDNLYNPIRSMADSMEELMIFVGLYSE